MEKSSGEVLVVAILLAVSLEGASQAVTCYTMINCGGGSTTPAADFRECCLGPGLSYNDGVRCRLCVVIGWAEASTPNNAIDSSPLRSAKEQPALYGFPVTFLKGSGALIRVRVTPIYETAAVADDIQVYPRGVLSVASGQDAVVEVQLRVDELAMEPLERFRLRLDPEPFFGPDLDTEVFIDELTIEIIDIDNVSIRFTQSYFRRPESVADGLIQVVVERTAQWGTPIALASPVVIQVIPVPYSVVNQTGFFLPPDFPLVDPFDPRAPTLAQGGTDFNASIITREFVAGGHSRDLDTSVIIFNDDTDEVDEVFAVLLELVSAVNPARVLLDERNASLCRIVDDEDDIALSFEFNSYTVHESESNLLVRVVKEPRGTAQTEITYTFSIEATSFEATAAEGVDYSLGAPGISFFDIIPETQSFWLVISIAEDNILEGTESFQLVLSSVVGTNRFQPGTFTSATVFIEDDDRVGVGFVREAIMVSESVGSLIEMVRVSNPDEMTSLPLSFFMNLMTVDDSAVGDEDYVPIAGRSNPLISPPAFGDDTRTRNITVEILNDNSCEGDEVFFLTLSSLPENVNDLTVFPNVSIITIRDDDSVVIGFSPASYIADEGTRSVYLVIAVLQGVISSDVILSLSTSDITATAGTDYELLDNFQFTMSRNDTTALVPVTIIQDLAIEPRESFSASLTLVSPNSCIIVTPHEANVAIDDDDLRAPGMPTAIVGSTTATTISLSWSVPSGSVVDSYEVMWERDTSGECPDEDEGSATIIVASTSYTITGLEEDSSYTITVTATKAAGNVVSDPITGMTGEAAPSAPLTFVSASDVTSSSITVQWGAVDCIHRNGNITGYSVRYGVRGSGSTQSVSVSGATETTIFGLVPSTNYEIEVAAVNSAGTGVYSSYIRVETDGVISVAIEFTGSTSLTISWTLVDGTMVNGYSISYSNTDTQCFTDSHTVSDIAAENTSHTLSNLEEGTEYTITVTALLTGGGTDEDSVTSNTLEAAPSAPPISVSASDVSFSSITVQWGAVDCVHQNGDITGYSVRYGVQGSRSSQTVYVSGGTTTEATISGLVPSTNYEIGVAAGNSAGTGIYNAAVIVKTSKSVFLTLNSHNIPRHGYVLISDIGSTNELALLCNTNYYLIGGNSGGEWFAPDGTQVDDTGTADVPGFVRNGGPWVVRLLRKPRDRPAEGMYRCEIQDATLTTQTVYVGLYNSGGGDISVSRVVTITVDSDLNEGNPQFTLTCTSTGGPATTVTWTRDSETVSGGMTVLDDPVTAQYTHTLTMAGRLGGQYKCTVSNNKPSINSTSFVVQVASSPTNFMAVQEGPTVIRVFWTPPTPLGVTTGYKIYYSGGSSGSVNVSGGSTDSHLLTGLQNGATYTISIVGTSKHLFSDHVNYPSSIPLTPGQPSVSAVSVATSIVLFWRVPSGSVVNSYEVVWGKDGAGSSVIIFDGSTSYTIIGLEEETNYTITVSATNTAGSAVSDLVSERTLKAVSSGVAQTDNTAAIVGGIIVVVLTIAVTIIVVVALLRFHCGLPTRNPVQEPISSVDVPTSINEAYELTRQAGKGGKEEEKEGVGAKGRRGEVCEYELVSAPPPVQPVAASEGSYEYIP